MNLEDIEKIIKMFEKSNVNTIDLEIDNIKIKLEKNNNTVVVTQPEIVKSNNCEKVVVNDVVDNHKYITSPLVGTFHEAPYHGGEAFVHVGDHIKKGQKLCIIEAMKVMNEINAPFDGVITKILVEEGSMVEFGANIFELEA